MKNESIAILIYIGLGLCAISMLEKPEKTIKVLKILIDSKKNKKSVNKFDVHSVDSQFT